MFGNIEFLLQQISENDLVVDVGGGHTPIARANKVIDRLSYQDYIKAGRQKEGIGEEHFSESDWIVMDFNYAKPLPFEDKSVDFVFCSGTLEDLGNPFWLCSEINRIGKRGYIEIPSRFVESLKGFEASKPHNIYYAGYYHHRWLIELINNELVFTYKTPLLNLNIHAYFTIEEIKDYLAHLRKYWSLAIYWKDHFKFKENIIPNEVLGIEKELQEFKKRCLKELENEYTPNNQEVRYGIWGTYIINS